ncbi:MAG TPA: competence protein TfoX [Rhodobacterales bacterium]|nr:competence protein TfoX [Rhodobacterales bacterium]
MNTPVSSLKNLGPVTERACARAGIDSAEALRALGADKAYARLLAHGEKPHFIGYIALVLGLMGRPWTDGIGAEKAALRRRFDGLVAASNTAPQGPATPAALERSLDEIGIPLPMSKPAGD